MGVNVRIVPKPRAVPMSAFRGAGDFSSVVSGAFGYVREHHIKQAAVRVELRNGIMLHSVAIPSQEWVADTANNKSTGSINLPPVGSLVFVLFPYGIENVAGAMVLFSAFDPENPKHKNHLDFLVEGNEAQAVTIREGGIKTTYDRKEKFFKVEDVDDSKLVILLDKKNKKLVVTDWNDNKITLDSNGMKLEAKGNTVSLQSGKTTINGNFEVSQ